jgi:hypothetical protein
MPLRRTAASPPPSPWWAPHRPSPARSRPPPPNPAPSSRPAAWCFRSLTEGNGPSPAPPTRWKVHYRGTFPDGREFDSSYQRKEPASFR